MSPITRNLPLALLLARLALTRAFRHSLLGPLWNSVGVALAIASIGLLFGTILRRQLDSFEAYVDHLAAGLVMWAFLSAVIGESSIAFARWMPILRHSAISLPTIAASIFLRHLPVFAVNLCLLLGLRFLLLDHPPAFPALAAAILLLLANVAWLGMAAMALAARFRDLGQLLPSLLQFAFLLTPILWPPYFLGRFEYLLLFNPFHHLLSIFADAMAGETAPAVNWMVGIGMALSGGAGAAVLLRWSRPRWPYWI
jgi:lipopolysaccharide transport system permease protein